MPPVSGWRLEDREGESWSIAEMVEPERAGESRATTLDMLLEDLAESISEVRGTMLGDLADESPSLGVGSESEIRLDAREESISDVRGIVEKLVVVRGSSSSEDSTSSVLVEPQVNTRRRMGRTVVTKTIANNTVPPAAAIPMTAPEDMIDPGVRETDPSSVSVCTTRGAVTIKMGRAAGARCGGSTGGGILKAGSSWTAGVQVKFCANSPLS
jgi:hypothetical protein